MPKSNNNDLFNQLEDTLSKLYSQLGKGNDLVCYMKTAGDGRRNRLDWEGAQGKTKNILRYNSIN